MPAYAFISFFSPKEMEGLYEVQDMCWEDFALYSNKSVKRSAEIQQMLSPYGDQAQFGLGTKVQVTDGHRCCLDYTL